MITSIIPFNNDPLGCYNYIDQKKYFTSITTNDTPNTLDLITFSSSGDSLVSASLVISCTSIGGSPNIVSYYNANIVVSITDGIASVVCSNTTPVCSESESSDINLDINTSVTPPVLTCELIGVDTYTVYWIIECSFKIIDGLLDPYCPEPNTYVTGTTSPDENNDPAPSAGPPSVTLPPAPPPLIDPLPVLNPPQPPPPDEDSGVESDENISFNPPEIEPSNEDIDEV